MTEPARLSSRDNPVLVQLRRLSRAPDAYRRTGQVWLEGDHLCQAWLAHGGQPLQALVSDSAWEQPALRELARSAARVSRVEDRLFAEVSALPSAAGLGFVIALPDRRPPQGAVPTVVLDRLQDAGNVGSVLRSAAAFGFRQVLALKGTAALWSPKVLRAGMGAHFGLRLVESVPHELLEGLGLPLVVTSSHARQSLPEAELPWPCAWVLGHEGQGVDDHLLHRAALAVRIPQPGGQESLNVAAAAAVCLYESARRRPPAGQSGQSGQPGDGP